MNYSFSDVGRHSVDLSLKTNQVSLTLQGRRLTVFAAKEKIWVLKHELDSFSILKDLSDEIGDVINKDKFLIF